jgi:hypothetical protein
MMCARTVLPFPLRGRKSLESERYHMRHKLRFRSCNRIGVLLAGHAADPIRSGLAALVLRAPATAVRRQYCASKACRPGALGHAVRLSGETGELIAVSNSSCWTELAAEVGCRSQCAVGPSRSRAVASLCTTCRELQSALGPWWPQDALLPERSVPESCLVTMQASQAPSRSPERSAACDAGFAGSAAGGCSAAAEQPCMLLCCACRVTGIAVAGSERATEPLWLWRPGHGSRAGGGGAAAGACACM